MPFLAAVKNRRDVGHDLVVARHLVGVDDWATVLAETGYPVDACDRNDPVAFAVGAVNRIQVTVAVAMHPDLAALLVIDQDGFVVAVIVPGVVGRVLKVVLDLAGVGVKRDRRVAIQVIALAHARIHVRRRVAHAPQHGVRLWVVGAGQPRRSATGLPRIIGPGFGLWMVCTGRSRLGFPNHVAGGRVQGRDAPDIATDVTTGVADDDHAFGNQGH